MISTPLRELLVVGEMYAVPNSNFTKLEDLAIARTTENLSQPYVGIYQVMQVLYEKDHPLEPPNKVPHFYTTVWVGQTNATKYTQYGVNGWMVLPKDVEVDFLIRTAADIMALHKKEPLW